MKGTVADRSIKIGIYIRQGRPNDHSQHCFTASNLQGNSSFMAGLFHEFTPHFRDQASQAVSFAAISHMRSCTDLLRERSDGSVG